MDRVSRREFQQYTSKYLKKLPIIVTMRGIDDFIVKPVEKEQKNDDGPVYTSIAKHANNSVCGWG